MRTRGTRSTAVAARHGKRWRYLAAGLVPLLLVLSPQALWAGPQPYTSSGTELGKDYVLQALERILPTDWAITEFREEAVPYHWIGAADALLVKVEDQSLTIHDPQGFEYHPFMRLYFCPSMWVGSMEETDFYSEQLPALLLGKNHIFRVFYQSRGTIGWGDVFDQLAVTFDLTRPPVGRHLRQSIDRRIRSRLAQRVSSIVRDLRRDALDRLVTIDRHGSLLYVEYVATVSSPPAGPGAPALLPKIREIVDKESTELAEQLFQVTPEVSTIYLRRICDNRMFDSLIDRFAQPAMSRAVTPDQSPQLPATDDTESVPSPVMAEEQSSL